MEQLSFFNGGGQSLKLPADLMDYRPNFFTPEESAGVDAKAKGNHCMTPLPGMPMTSRNWRKPGNRICKFWADTPL
jgi:hypothetical protein